MSLFPYLQNTFDKLTEKATEHKDDIIFKFEKERTNSESRKRKDISEEQHKEFIKEYESLQKSIDFDLFVKTATLVSKRETLDKIDHMSVQKIMQRGLLSPNSEKGENLFDFTKKGSVFWTQYVLSTSPEPSLKCKKN